LEELVLEFYPMKTKGVQKGRNGLHAEQDSPCQSGPSTETDPGRDRIGDCEREKSDTLEEDFRELRMGQRKSPKTKVRGSVRNGTENELDGVDHLMDKDLVEIKLIFFLLMMRNCDGMRLRGIMDVGIMDVGIMINVFVSRFVDQFGIVSSVRRRLDVEWKGCSFTNVNTCCCGSVEIDGLSRDKRLSSFLGGLTLTPIMMSIAPVSTEEIGLGEEHPGDGNDSKEDKDLLDSLLAIKHVIDGLDLEYTLEHRDHQAQEFGCLIIFDVHPVHAPLPDDEESHVAKDG
jgi:hypothetical protein